MGDKQKIAILLPDLGGGGAERVSLDLAHEFTRMGHRVEFVVMHAVGEFLGEAQSAFTIFDLQANRFMKVPGALARYLQKSKPDSLIAAMWPLTVIASVARSITRHRFTLLISEHCDLSSQYREWGVLHRLVLRASMAMTYRGADARVGVSQGVVDDIARLAFMQKNHFQVIHNPVAARTIQKPTALADIERLWKAPGGERILSVGSFKKQKNHPLLLRAFARMQPRPNSRLMLLGNGDDEPDLRLLCSNLDISHQVIFAGFHEDVRPFYETADLFVLSSDYEGFGNVIVEALACGTPVVSTNCPSGPAEILDGGRFGALVPVGDEAGLAKAIISTLSTPYDPAQLQFRAKAFAPEIAAVKYLGLLQCEPSANRL
ncbi:glycosyltransferase [Hoeflea sp. TYP-13]|uniref:glycosyltransferase n=1 Tax=Hoeflea sp. TYP-13 TaxID=3230023 RepID=UPI0034C68ACA